MMKLYYPIFLLLAICWGCAPQPETGTDSPQEEFTGWVDPFIGTGGHGHTYPGASVPFGMVQLSPDNGSQGWDWVSGYHISDSTIVGFSHTHLSGTGIGDLCDISLMPTTAGAELKALGETRRDVDYISTFSHDHEIATPGYYSVLLQKTETKVELTSTPRVGFHRYTFAQPNPAIILDLGFAINWDSPTEVNLKVLSDTEVTGYRLSKGWAQDQRVYFAIRFSEPIVGHSSLVDDAEFSQPEITGQNLKTIFNFDGQPGKSILVKVGISTTSTDAAQYSLEKEISDWDFDRVREDARIEWENYLSKIRIHSNDSESKKIFYTALYHTHLAPVVYSDLDGKYKGADGKVHEGEYDKYGILSLWDTFRAFNPLFTILHPNRIDDLVQSMLAHYQQYNLLPVWELLGNETNTMTGYHAVPVIADAYLKGLTESNSELVFEAMKTSGMQDIRGVSYYKEYGYIPSDLENESVTKNLEYAYDDWCIAQVAQKLGKSEDYDYFIQRASSYSQLFDPETGFMRGKSSQGKWRAPFDPKKSTHRVNTDYTEGNAYQHSWFVPHDVQGLINLHGGTQPFILKLDSLFSESSEITGDDVSPDISGLIGQYAHGNEPSHHIAYLYNYAGAPWKTQEKVRQILSEQYDATPEGLSGNEDCGQMSAWYVFSALGFYPVNPAEGIYVIGTPIFEEAIIDLSEGKTFEIVAQGVSENNFYIQSASLNGAPLERGYINHTDITAGGELNFVMGATPNYDLWTTLDSFPPSMSAALSP